MVSRGEHRKKTEALDVDVVDALHVIRLELAQKGNGWGKSRLPSYSDAVRHLLEREGYL